MGALFTIDASVFVASCRPREQEYAASGSLLRLARDAGVPLIEPAILPIEIAAALGRAGIDPKRVSEYAEAVMSLPYLTLQPVDKRLARLAADLAAQCRLRGADALYATVAAQYGAHLVTLDAEQLRRAPVVVHACKPDAAAALLK